VPRCQGLLVLGCRATTAGDAVALLARAVLVLPRQVPLPVVRLLKALGVLTARSTHVEAMLARHRLRLATAELKRLAAPGEVETAL
jgi:hypothetical protein